MKYISFTETKIDKTQSWFWIGYVSRAEELKEMGVNQIFCFTVCDPFVVAAWAENQVSFHFSNFSSI